MVVLFICIYGFLLVWVVVAVNNGGLQKKFCLNCLMHLSPLSPGTAGRSSEKSLRKSGRWTSECIRWQSCTRMRRTRKFPVRLRGNRRFTADCPERLRRNQWCIRQIRKRTPKFRISMLSPTYGLHFGVIWRVSSFLYLSKVCASCEN